MPSMIFREAIRSALADRHIFLDQNYFSSASPDQLRHPDQLDWTDDIRIEAHTGFYRGKALCSMGAFSYCNGPVIEGMTIGRYCALAWGLKFPGPRHAYEWASISNLTYDRKAANVQSYLRHHDAPQQLDPRVLNTRPMPVVGNDVWIGQGVSLGRGVTIGDGAVIAGFSVVTKPVPPFEIWGGNPARKIKDRFDEKTKQQLLESQWWRFEPKQFADLDFSDTAHFATEMLRRHTDLEPYASPVTTTQELEAMDSQNPGNRPGSNRSRSSRWSFLTGKSRTRQ